MEGLHPPAQAHDLVLYTLHVSVGVTWKDYCQPAETDHFIALIHPIQWTIANPVGAERPATRQKKTSCVSTGRPVPVLCTHQVAHHTSFLSRQRDVIASFSFGACTVRTCFQQSPKILKKSMDYHRFSTLIANILV